MVDFYGTVKQYKNMPSFDNSMVIDMNKLFMTDNNKIYLAHKLYDTNRENGGHANLTLFHKLAPKLMEKYLGNKNLNDANYCDDAASTVKQIGIDTYQDGELGTNNIISTKRNWIETFRAINHEFMAWAAQFLGWNNFIPYRAKTTTGTINEFENTVRDVKNYNMLHEDKQQMNVWQQYDINTSRDKFRYNNTIPIWQFSMNTRHYDRSNEGLREGNDPYRSSLDNPVYAYDMRRVKELMNTYQDEKWFGF